VLFQGISDGAGSVILASEAACNKYGLTPLARVTGYGVAGIHKIKNIYTFRILFNDSKFC